MSYDCHEHKLFWGSSMLAQCHVNVISGAEAQIDKRAALTCGLTRLGQALPLMVKCLPAMLTRPARRPGCGLPCGDTLCVCLLHMPRQLCCSGDSRAQGLLDHSVTRAQVSRSAGIVSEVCPSHNSLTYALCCSGTQLKMHDDVWQCLNSIELN